MSNEMFVVWLRAERAYFGRLIRAEEELHHARTWPDRAAAQEFADALGPGVARVLRVCVGRDRRQQ